jgi:iron transport multicopper oxidase
MEQARTVRMNLTCGAARPNPQGSFRYGRINMSRTLLLRNDEAEIGGRRRCTVNGVSFAGAATPLKLADHFDLAGVFAVVSGRPERRRQPSLGTAVIDARYRDFVQIVFENRVPSLQTWHLDGYNFFVAGCAWRNPQPLLCFACIHFQPIFLCALTKSNVVCDEFCRMGWGKWSPDARSTYNLVDAIYRSTVQVTLIRSSMFFHGFLKRFLHLIYLPCVLVRLCYCAGVPVSMDGRVGVSGQRGDVEPEVAESRQEVLGPGDLHESEPGQLRSP